MADSNRKRNNFVNASDGVFQRSVLRGRSFKSCRTILSLCFVLFEESVPRGKKSRISPFLFSFLPRS